MNLILENGVSQRINFFILHLAPVSFKKAVLNMDMPQKES